MKYLNIKIVLISISLLLTTQFGIAGAIEGKKFKDWQGRCQPVKNQDFCYILQGFSADGKKALMITTVDVKQHPKKIPLVTFRVSNDLDPTKEVMFKVDKNEPISIKATCDKERCSMAFGLDKRMLSEFKRGNRGVIGFVAKGSDKPVYYPVSLSGFSKALRELKKS
jgi:invasion protein IalB